jgi:hypothetical protein
MNNTSLRALRALVLATASLFIFQPVALADPPARLFSGLNDQPRNSLPEHAMNAPGLRGRLNPGALARSRLMVTLPGGRSAVARQLRHVQADNRLTWVGEFDGQPGTVVSLTVRNGIVGGFLDDGERIYEVTWDGAGFHSVYEIDADALPDFGHPPLPEEVGGGDTGGSAPPAAAASIVQDLLVVYTPASRNRWGGSDPTPVENRIISAVEAANQAYQNSALDLQLNIVYLDEIAYTESGDMGVSLDHLRLTSDGNLDSAHTLRDQYGADLVALITEDSNYCGIAYVMTSDSTSFAPWAVGVTYSSCLTNQTLAHEIGHNQGNMHDRPNSSNSGVFAYSYGFRRCLTDGTGFRTVMSYSCSGGTRVNHFSNPDVTYNGFATGIDHDVDPANSADAVRSMAITAPTVAAFRSSAASTPPADPSSLGASAPTHDRVDLNWSDNAGDETGFRIERSTDGSSFSQIATLGANASSYSDTGRAASTLYYYRVRAYNGAGNSGYSNVASATTQAPPPPPATPGSFSASAVSGSRIDLGWSDVADEAGYRLERADDAGGPFDEIADLPSGATSYSDSSLELGVEYHYRLFAYNGSGNSDAAGPVSARTLTFSDAYAQSSSVSQGSMAGSVSNTRDDDGSTHRLTEAESGGKPSRRTSRAQATWQFSVSPGMTMSLHANAWVTGDLGEDSFDFEYSVNGSGYTPLFMVDSGDSTATYMASLPASTSGTVSVRATDTDRGQGARSLETLHVDQLMIRTESDPSATPPAAPSGVNATAASHSLVQLDWTDNAGDESGFRVERSTDGSNWSAVGTAAAGQTSYDDSDGLSASATYYYRVAAFNGAGNSGWASSNAVTTPAAPAGPSLNASGYKVKGRQNADLSWTGAAGNVEIFRNGSQVGTSSSAGDGSGSYTDNIGAKGGGTYDYEVCDAGTSVCSNTARVVF